MKIDDLIIMLQDVANLYGNINVEKDGYTNFTSVDVSSDKQTVTI